MFDGCKIVDLAEGKGSWNFSRTWQNTPIVVFKNTTLDDNAAQTIIATRWTPKGMNNTEINIFGEYNTMNVLPMHALTGAYSPDGEEWVEELCETLSGNARYACGQIRKWPDISVMQPSFHAWAIKPSSPAVSVATTLPQSR